MNAKISIIVPIYNGEKYLQRCINSLLKQTLDECEFILVDDGSTDSSLNIINRFVNIDNRIKVIHQENLGVSIARNTGIKHASGDYIGFLDVDDWVQPDMFEKLYNAASFNDCDMSFCNYEYRINGDIGVVKYPFATEHALPKEYIKNYIIPYILEFDNYNNVWTKIYKRESINKHKIKFEEGIRFGEDYRFNAKFLVYAQSIIYINYTGYHYEEVLTSITRSKEIIHYFNSMISVYNTNNNTFQSVINEDLAKILNSKKLSRSVLALIHDIYFDEKIDKTSKIITIKKMINEDKVKEAMSKTYIILMKEKGYYNKVLFLLMRLRSYYLIYLFIRIIENKNKLLKREKLT